MTNFNNTIDFKQNKEEHLHFADTAFANRQYDEALKWYGRVLEAEPGNIHALFHTGVITLSQGRHEESLQYFAKARELDPDNGDTAYTYGTAFYYTKNFAKAFEQYVEAERLGCREDVLVRMYYKMASICIGRRDTKSARIYLKKGDEADTSGVVSLHPQIIREKFNMYLILRDFENAEKCSAQLLATDPSDFDNYLLYANLLKEKGDNDKALKVLLDAEKYVDLTAEERILLNMQKDEFTATTPEEKVSDKSVKMLEDYCNSDDISEEDRFAGILTLTTLLIEKGDYDKVIDYLKPFVELTYGTEDDYVPVEEVAEYDTDPGYMDEETYDAIQKGMDEFQEMMDTGMIDVDMIRRSAEIAYDEDGNEYYEYDESVFHTENKFSSGDDAEDAETEKEAYELTVADREKARFTLMTAYMCKDDYAKAIEIANTLKHSETRFYAHHGLYTATALKMKQEGYTDRVQAEYAKALAYFKARSFEDPSDSLAQVFRARLYVEQGKNYKAREIANLLSENDRQAVLRYVDSYAQFRR